MRLSPMLYVVLLGIFPVHAGPPPETAVPGIAPLPKPTFMTQDELSEFFQQQKKGTPLQLTLAKDKTVNGIFSSYDEYYDTVWLVPQGEKGVFLTKGYRLSGIHNAAFWDRKASPAIPHTVEEAGNRDYYLLKDSGMK